MGKLDVCVFILVSAVWSIVNGLDPLCGDMLLQSLPDDHITASSYQQSGAVESQPYRGRLNTTESYLANGTLQLGAWAPTESNDGQYIQAMFDETVMINGLMNQGRNQANDYVTHYKVEYTEDGVTWQTINNDIGVENIFMGNSDGDTIVENSFECPIFAKGIRLIPMGWSNHIAMRFEVNGCYLDNSVVVVTSSVAPVPTIAAPNTTLASFLPGIQTPFGPTGPRGMVTQSTTINMLTLVQWFMSHINNHTSPTTPVTQKTTPTTRPTTTRTTTRKPTTTPYMFMPGIANPFATSTKAAGVVHIG